MTQTTINRRRALAVVAAVPAAVALGGATVVLGEPGQLAALVGRYFSELETFGAFLSEDERTDEQADAFAARTYEATRDRMIGVPARSREDALAAIDWIISDGKDCLTDLDDEVTSSLVHAIRGYIEGRVS